MDERRYDAVVFDLDGTLLDTLTDLMNSANAAAEKYGFAPHTREEIRSFVGNGIRRLIRQVVPEGDKTAIVSNKADFAVKKLKDVYFNELIDVAIGEHEGCRRKPEPDSVLIALENIGVDRKRAVYVGDSDVDILTAKNTSMDCICVSWGFRSREFLLDHGAVPEQIAANVNELKALLEG